jgi:hypothetical protein
MYPKGLQILLEGVTDTKERIRRIRLIRIYQRPVTAEEKKIVNEANKKAYPNKGKKSSKKNNKKGKKGKNGKKKRR